MLFLFSNHFYLWQKGANNKERHLHFFIRVFIEGGQPSLIFFWFFVGFLCMDSHLHWKTQQDLTTHLLLIMKGMCFNIFLFFNLFFFLFFHTLKLQCKPTVHLQEKTLCGLVGIIIVYCFVWISQYYLDSIYKPMCMLALTNTTRHGTNIMLVNIKIYQLSASCKLPNCFDNSIFYMLKNAQHCITN